MSAITRALRQMGSFSELTAMLTSLCIVQAARSRFSVRSALDLDDCRHPLFESFFRHGRNVVILSMKVFWTRPSVVILLVVGGGGGSGAVVVVVVVCVLFCLLLFFAERWRRGGGGGGA